MEQTPSLEISATTPDIEYEHDLCKRKLWQALARRVKVQAGNRTMLVCPDCYDYYWHKSSTTTNSKSFSYLF
jgi:uncharacterized protein with PIN domain